MRDDLNRNPTERISYLHRSDKAWIFFECDKVLAEIRFQSYCNSITGRTYNYGLEFVATLWSYGKQTEIRVQYEIVF